MWQFLGIILGLFGAIGGIIWFKDKISATWRMVRHGWTSRVDVPDDFYYASVEIALRWHKGGRLYLAIRKARIVAIQELREFHIGVGPTSVGNFKLQMEPDELKLDMTPTRLQHRDMDDWTARLIPPLKRKSHCDYSLSIEGRADSGKSFPPLISWGTGHRVDELILRVVFTEDEIPTVMFKVLDLTGHCYEERPVIVDKISHEARWVVKPKPRFEYRLTWAE